MLRPGDPAVGAGARLDVPDLVRAVIRKRHAAWHFLLFGGLLFLAQQWLFPDPSSMGTDFEGLDGIEAFEPGRVDEELLYREALRRGLDRNDAVVRQRLIRNMRFLEPETELEDEALLRQALDLGLDREDVVVRRRLVERMRRILVAETPLVKPSPRELEAYLAERGARFAVPARIRLEQVHFDEAPAAAAALDRLHSGKSGALELRGDPLPLARRFPSLSERELAARLGPEFALRAFELEPGHWTGPVATSYGHSLVFVHEREPTRSPELEEVKLRVLGEWRAEREAEALEVALQKLRSRAGLPAGRDATP